MYSITLTIFVYTERARAGNTDESSKVLYLKNKLVQNYFSVSVFVKENLL